MVRQAARPRMRGAGGRGWSGSACGEVSARELSQHALGLAHMPETAWAAARARLHVRGRQAGLEQLGQRALQLVAPVQLQVALQAGLGRSERVLGRLVLRGRARQQHVGYALAQHERAARVPLLRARARPCCSDLHERLQRVRSVRRHA